jgi:phosphatidylglycerol:prolipoprotein diacylglycerol transferase
LDVFTPALAIFSIFLGLSHLASGKAFGIPTSLPWGINLWGEKRHPSQVYEIFAALIILLIFWWRFGKQTIPGALFLLIITATAGVRLFLETWRGDNMALIGGIRLSQLIAWFVMALGLILLDRRLSNN